MINNLLINNHDILGTILLLQQTALPSISADNSKSPQLSNKL